MRASDQRLAERTATAIRWRFASSAIGAASQLVVGALLARLLAPADYGIVALAFVVAGLARLLGDLGIGSAVVQRADLTERHIRAAFTASTLLGMAVAGAVALAAPLGAFAMSDDRITPIVRTLALGFALSGASAVAAALVRRRLDFKRLFAIDSVSYLLGFGGLAMFLAWQGYGAWSLVWGNLLQTLLASALVLAIAGHSVRPLLARRELGDLLHFGVGAHLSACANYVALQGDNFIVGRAMGAASLGLYSRAYALMNIPFTYGASVLSSALFPAFAQIQAEPARLRRAFLLATELTAMVSASTSGILAIVAPHLVPTLYGGQWAGVVAPLQILCIAGYFRALYHLGGVVAQSVGLVYSELRNQIIYAALVLAGAAAGSRYGLNGVALGVGLAIVFMFGASGRLALRAARLSWREYFHVQRAALVTALATSAVALALRSWLEVNQLPSAVITVVVVSGAALPLCGGILWSIGGPGFEPVRALLPGFCRPVAEALRRRSGSTRLSSPFA